MFNPRINSIVAGSALILSLLIGILSNSSFPTIIVRPIIFAVFFFFFTGLVSSLVSRFLPELIDGEIRAPELIVPGSRIDITEDAPIAPGVAFARPDESNEEMGDISELMEGGSKKLEPEINTQTMDQTEQNVYTDIKVSGSLSENGDSFDALPDLEGLVGAFLPSSGEQEEEIQEYSSSEPVKRSVSGNKSQKMDVDFHPKELAAGIRTVLKKDDV